MAEWSHAIYAMFGYAARRVPLWSPGERLKRGWYVKFVSIDFPRWRVARVQHTARAAAHDSVTRAITLTGTRHFDISLTFL